MKLKEKEFNIIINITDRFSIEFIKTKEENTRVVKL
jgi:hypothetical protein